MTLTIIGFLAVFVLLFAGLPLTFGLGVVGFVGFTYIVGPAPAFAMTAQIAWDTLSNYSLAILPLFLLMGNLVNRAGLSQELYDASNAFVGHRKGGLAMATIIACGGFAAVCGSSVATAATMAKIALPPMRRYGYSEALSTASVAAGGTLGILIPPSAIMVIYGTMTETSVGKLFIAGIIPGLLGILLYVAAVGYHTIVDPKAGAGGPRTPWSERWKLLAGVWPTVALFVLVIGGIYGGVFAAQEAAGIGAAGAFLVALFRGALTVRSLMLILAETVRTTAMLMVVLIGALVFTNFINLTNVSSQLVSLIQSYNLSPLNVILIIIIFYVLLGCVFESLAMILLTIPVFFPLVTSIGFDPVWFGVLIVMMVEIAQITPPIGMNLFVIKALSPGLKNMTLYRGIAPFIAADLIRVATIVFLPGLVLFLPNQMM